MARFTDRRLFHLALVLWLMIFFAPGTARSQVEMGRIGGTVTDPGRAVIPNAQVTVTNVATGAIRNVKSDTSGYYLAANLLSGKEVYLSVAGNSGPLSLALNAAGLSALTGAILGSGNSINKGGIA